MKVIKWLMCCIKLYPEIMKKFFTYIRQAGYGKQNLEDMNRLHRGMVFTLGEHWKHVLFSFLRVLWMPVWMVLKFLFVTLRAVFTTACFLLFNIIAVLSPIIGLLYTPYLAYLVLKIDGETLDDLEREADML